MSDPKLKVIREFRRSVESGNIDNLKIVYKVSGGPPGNQIVKEIIIPGFKEEIELNIKDQSDQFTEMSNAKRSLRQDSTEKHSLFKQIASDMQDLTSLSKPIFLPDSVVGSLTIQTENNEDNTIYFLVDEVDRKIQNKPIPPGIANVIKDLERITKTTDGDNNG